MANNSFATFFGASYPAEGNVLNTAPTYGDSQNVLNGTYDPGGGGVVPSANDVRDGVAVGAGTGNLVVPVPANVRDGITYDSPAVQQTGLLVSPAQNQVILGVTYGASAEYTGNVRIPSANDVRLAVSFGSLDTLTGNVRVPVPAQVLAGVGYDTNDNVIGSRTDCPAVSALASVSYGDPASQTVGRWHEENLSSAVIQSGITYGVDLGETGTLDPGGAPDYPSQNDVRLGVIYSSGALTGNVRVPPADKVEKGYQYDANDILTGTLVGVEVSPFIEGDVFQIVQGDDYLMVWTDNGAWPDLTGGTVKFGHAGGTFEKDATIVGSDPQQVQVAFTKEDTASMLGWYLYDVQATINGAVSTLVRGQHAVKRTQTDVPVSNIPGGLW